MRPDDQRYLLRAIELANRGSRATAPNPRVGAVVVRSGRVVGEGWHQRAGQDHAEVMALAQAGADAKGATLFVSLEPCAHHGRTPPCTEAIRQAGIDRVVVAQVDPDERVRGNGLKQLEESGIEVVLAGGEIEDIARDSVEEYVVHRSQGRAFVALKIAATLDGRIADREGHARWITGEQARLHGRRLRDRYSAILVGAGTVHADDPTLLPPSDETQGGPFLRCVLDGGLTVSPESKLFDSRTSWAPVVVFCHEAADPERRAALENKGVEIVPLPGLEDDDEGRRVCVVEVLRVLAQRDVLGVVVEGGGATHGAFLGAGVVDRVHWYVNTAVLGDPNAVPSVSIGRRSLDERCTFLVDSVESLGADVLLTMRVPRDPVD